VRDHFVRVDSDELGVGSEPRPAEYFVARYETMSRRANRFDDPGELNPEHMTPGPAKSLDEVP